MNILICGGRDYQDRETFNAMLDGFVDLVEKVIEGGAQGADSLASEWAIINNKDHVKVPADWDNNGRAAGFIRNQKMINMNPDLVIAFWDGKSKGTKDTISKAKTAKIKTLIVYY